MSGPLLSAAAQALARIGYVAIPLNADRRPVFKGWPDAEGGETSARERFEHCAAHGMALVTRGFIVVDLDRGHADGVDGVASFAALVDAHGGDFPEHGPRVRTRRGGAWITAVASARWIRGLCCWRAQTRSSPTWRRMMTRPGSPRSRRGTTTTMASLPGTPRTR